MAVLTSPAPCRSPRGHGEKHGQRDAYRFPVAMLQLGSGGLADGRTHVRCDELAAACWALPWCIGSWVRPRRSSTRYVVVDRTILKVFYHVGASLGFSERQLAASFSGEQRSGLVEAVHRCLPAAGRILLLPLNNVACPHRSVSGFFLVCVSI